MLQGDSVDQCWSFWILVDAPRDIKFIDHQIYYTRNKSVKDGQWLYRKVNKGPAKKLRQGISRRGDPGIIRLPGLERTSYLHEGQEKHKPCLLDWSEEKEDGTLRFMYRVDIVSSGVDQTAHYTLMEPGFIPPEQPLIRKGTTERPSGGFYLDADRLQWEGAIAQLQRVPAKPTNVTPPPKTSPSPTSSKTVPSQNAVVPTSTRSTSTTNRDERSTSLITQSSVEEKSTSTPPTANSQSASVSPGDVSPTTRRLFFRPKGGPGEVK
ncbi:hypothetical protein PRZ48_012198 [Zasmidium cellare]|uniref:Uncharacterized protein n=1 Tax=Zasmidium cellare TaxID=395010 RepID=A0ABR0E477_ZASCE|nr:hypothetical protein PRZ48_012198 [Zasmidium cellare]